MTLKDDIKNEVDDLEKLSNDTNKLYNSLLDLFEKIKLYILNIFK